MKFYTAFDRRPVSALTCVGPGRTKQAHKDECDINKLLERYNRTGKLPGMIKGNPMYGDFSGVMDYQDALAVVEKAGMQFAALPARVRERFKNDPAQFLDFCGNPENRAEMSRLGLLKAEAQEAPGGGSAEGVASVPGTDGTAPSQPVGTAEGGTVARASQA